MIKIICVGKIKEKYFNDAINEYLKRLSKYTNIKIIEVKDFKDNSLKKEKEEIIKYLNEKDYIICLDIKGKQLDSIEFSKLIDKTFISYSNITFVIGGSYGLDKEIKDKANYLLSFSKMTFPHQLFRIILLEQIYRSYKIINNESYHK